MTSTPSERNGRASTSKTSIKTINDDFAAWSVGEPLLNDRVYHALKSSRSGIGGLDMDKSREQSAEQPAVGRV